MTTLYFHGLELDIHRTPDLSRAPDGAGMFEIWGVKVDDRLEWGNWYWEQPGDLKLLMGERDILDYVRRECRAAIEAAYEAEARL